MKNILRSAIIAAAALLPAGVSAQYYEIANQLPGMIQPILSGSLNYKGFIEASYTQGLGHYKANFLTVSTSQGFRYSNWFYMGVGAGVDFLFSNVNDNWGSDWNSSYYDNNGFDTGHSSRVNAVMVPLFTDFRFNIGGNPMNGPAGSLASFFIDLKVGCSFLCSDDYIRINNGYLTNQQYFYFQPSMGVRIPLSKKNPSQAFDLGVTYKLLTSNYWSSWQRNVTLSSLGVTAAFEW